MRMAAIAGAAFNLLIQNGFLRVDFATQNIDGGHATNLPLSI